MTTTTTVLGPTDGRAVQIGGLGVRFMIGAEASEGGFSLVEHPLAPRALGAPMHTHEHEDEYSFVLEGEVGLELGGETVVARPGDLVFKPRGVPHAFWNPSDRPARLLEIISPGGFERYFEEIAPLFPADGPPDFPAVMEVAARYGLEFDMNATPRLARDLVLDVPMV